MFTGSFCYLSSVHNRYHVLQYTWFAKICSKSWKLKNWSLALHNHNYIFSRKICFVIAKYQIYNFSRRWLRMVCQATFRAILPNLHESLAGKLDRKRPIARQHKPEVARGEHLFTIYAFDFLANAKKLIGVHFLFNLFYSWWRIPALRGWRRSVRLSISHYYVGRVWDRCTYHEETLQIYMQLL